MEGDARSEYYEQLMDSLWTALEDKAEQYAIHLDAYDELKRGKMGLAEFHAAHQAHTCTRDRDGKEIRIVEVGRVNAEFISKAWKGTKWAARITRMEERLAEFVMDKQSDRTAEMAEELERMEKLHTTIRTHIRPNESREKPRYDRGRGREWSAPRGGSRGASGARR